MIIIPAFVFYKKPACLPHNSSHNPLIHLLLINLKSRFCYQMPKADYILEISKTSKYIYIQIFKFKLLDILILHKPETN